MPEDRVERTALVTGANQGVGLEVAGELVANGLSVLVGSRNLGRGDAAAKEIGPGAIALQLDVTDASSIEVHGSVGAWAKGYYFAVRAAMESVLRPYDLGSTQWHVLSRLANVGPTMQRDLARLLQIERATLSGIVATPVGKGLVDQMPGSEDRRQRMLRITDAGRKLWAELPDPLAVIREIAFEGADPADLAIALRVLQSAARRLNDRMAADNQSIAGRH